MRWTDAIHKEWIANLLLLAAGVEGELRAFLPLVPPNGPAHELRCRAAMASTLVAGLEFARNGVVSLVQEGHRPIRLRRTGQSAREHAPA